MSRINTVQDENYIDLIISDNTVGAYLPENTVTALEGGYSMVNLQTERLDMCLLGQYPNYAFPDIYTLNSQISLEKSGITTVQQNKAFNLFGQGVIIAMIDTGIDYNHSAFKNADDTTRIISIWDQTAVTGMPPEGYTYGAEYQYNQINTALKNENPQSVVPVVDEIGHGTMLAGIAAGNQDLEAGFAGVASSASLLVVKLKQAKRLNRQIYGISPDIVCYQETDLLLGVKYAVETAERLNKPLVLCIGMGTSQGAHDGEGILSGYLDFLAQVANVGVVIAGGNEGNSRRHYLGGTKVGEEYHDFELNVGSGDKSFYLEIWQRQPHRIAIEITSPLGEAIERVFPTINECRNFNLILESSVIWVNNINLEELSGNQMILVRFRNAESGIWKFRIIGLDTLEADFNVWLPAGDIISNNTYLLNSNAEITLTTPGNTRYTMVVTAYNQNDDSILTASGQGYTRSGIIKPDFAAPGYQLTCPLPGGGYGSASGTSAAAAHTAGIAALLLEWAVLRGNYTDINNRDMTRILIRGARRQENLTYPNQVWGYGEVDLLGAFEKLR